jgi:hypothetical protein
MNKIVIHTGQVELEAELNDQPTAKLIWNALPLEGSANRWGDEIYFEIPVKTGSEKDARAETQVGELGYWPPGHAFCIFFGPTPVSHNEQPCAYSPVNILGRVIGDATHFRKVKSGEKVRIERKTT